MTSASVTLPQFTAAEWIYIIQAAISLLALFAIFFQLISLNRDVSDAVSRRSIEYFQEITKFMNANPRVREAFQKSNPQFMKLSNDERQVYEFLGLVLSFYEPLWKLKKARRMKFEVWKAWDNWLRERILEMDLFSVFWSNEKMYYSASFQRYVDGKLKQGHTGKGRNIVHVPQSRVPGSSSSHLESPVIGSPARGADPNQ